MNICFITCAFVTDIYHIKIELIIGCSLAFSHYIIVFIITLHMDHATNYTVKTIFGLMLIFHVWPHIHGIKISITVDN